MASFALIWEAPEYEYREKDVSWYWISIIVAALVVAFSISEKNFLFGLFVVLAEVLFIVWGNRVPRIVHFTLNENGIEVRGGAAHPWSSFESMGVEAAGSGFAELVFIFRAKLKTPFKVLFPEDRLTELRGHLKTILKEIPYEPTLIDSIEKLLRF